MLRDIIKKETYKIHKYVESAPIMYKILNKSVSKKDYIIYLTNLSIIYKSIENNLLYKKFELNINLYEKCLEDIRSLCIEEIEPLEITKLYCDYLDKIDNIDVLMGHIYVRYMGDLMGGEIIKKRLLSIFPKNIYNIDNKLLVKEKIVNYINNCVVDTELFKISVNYSFNVYAAILYRI